MIMLLILIYLIGCILSYILLKKNWIMTFKDWTVGDRKVTLVISFFSWVGVITALFSMSWKLLSGNDDEPAKW